MSNERGDDRPVVETMSDLIVRVLVVAEVRLYREGIQNALAARSQFAVVGAAANADEALKQIPLLRPDVVIVDMATRQSLEIARAIHEQASGITPEVKIVAFGV